MECVCEACPCRRIFFGRCDATPLPTRLSCLQRKSFLFANSLNCQWACVPAGVLRGSLRDSNQATLEAPPALLTAQGVLGLPHLAAACPACILACFSDGYEKQSPTST